MTNRRFTSAGILRWASLIAVAMVLAPSSVFATHFELSRLANQVELISDQLADELRYTRHYGSVRQRAVTLRREAGQLADSLARNRSNSRIRSQFKDVRQGYERLEAAFFIADRRDHIPSLYRDVNLLSDVFASLNEEFYYAGLGRQSYEPVYIAPYRGQSIIGSRTTVRRYPDFPRSYSRQSPKRDRDYRTGRQIVPARERAIPPVFRGNNGRLNTRGEADRVGRDGAGAERGARSVHSAPPSAHTSNVLERQGRQNAARRELQSQARPGRSPVTQRQSSRGVNVERGRSGSAATRRRD